MADANAIFDRIRTVTQRCYARDRDSLTVNIVRNIVESELGLEQGILKSEAWKKQSKEGVLDEVQRLDCNLSTPPIPPKRATLSAGPPQPAKSKKSPSPMHSDVDPSATKDSSDSYDEEPSAKKSKKGEPESDAEAISESDFQKSKSKSKGKRTSPAKKLAQKPKKRLIQRKKKADTASDSDEGAPIIDEGSGGSDGGFHGVDSESDAQNPTGRRSSKNVVSDDEEESEFSEDEKLQSNKKAARKKTTPVPAKRRLVQKKGMKEDIGDKVPENLRLVDNAKGPTPTVSPLKRGGATAEKPATRAKPTSKAKTTAKRLSSTQVIDSSDDEEDKEVKRKSPTKAKTRIGQVHDDESEMSEVFDPSPKKRPFKSSRPFATEIESEMSDIIDPEPPAKKPRKSAGTTPKSTIKSAPKSRAAVKPKSSDPEADEIKVLTQQLGKCGIRKVWGAYLKKALGSDADHRTKISHLKSMLKEIGMEGKFSEQRAKEIRTRLELERDLEVLEETSKGWGIDTWGAKGSAGRPHRRAAAKNLKEPELKLNLSDDEQEKEVVEADDDEEDSDAESGSGSGSGTGSGEDGNGDENSDEEPKEKRRGRKVEESEESEFDDESD